MQVLTSYHPALLALESLYDQFPGAIQLCVFCQDDGLKVYETTGKNADEYVVKNRFQAENKVRIQKFRQQKKEMLWGDKDDLPIAQSNQKSRTIKQLTIQDEIDQNILIFRIPSSTDDAYDVFALTFSKSFSNFYIPSGRNVLSSEMKGALGRMIRNQIKWLYNLHDKQGLNIRRIQQAYLQNADEVDVLNEQLEQEKINNRALLERYLNQLIQRKELELDANIQLKKGFLDKIIRIDIGINELKQVVEDAVLTAYDLAMDKQVIQLSPNLISVQNKKIDNQKSTQLIALDKTQALLDKYEQAARQLNDESVRINGRNLAKELGISGPAITDAIKKHQHKIERLIDKYPSSWPLICEFIRPLQEIKWKAAASG